MRYSAGGVTHTREHFSSAPDEVIATRLRASQPGAITFLLGLDRPERAATRAEAANPAVIEEDRDWEQADADGID